ncbi:hypothetical protein EVAR_79718_1 [Eumeta japonica]|uniref:Mos1 transposase HTH domain-containing protein n=1 Tax=Eumeta variegata TaxID=151549 RepID=A0A4C1T929_EUMVA|nr:hypothetical protein EVAR_79718_1 [Eumeta japonica]
MDEFKEGRLKTVVVPQNVDVMRKVIMQDRHVTYGEIKASLGITTCSATDTAAAPSREFQSLHDVTINQSQSKRTRRRCGYVGRRLDILCENETKRKVVRGPSNTDPSRLFDLSSTRVNEDTGILAY